MRWRVGLADVSAALVVAVIILMPPREAQVEDAYYDHVDNEPVAESTTQNIARLQAALHDDPADTDSADRLAEILANLGQSDDALRVAGSAASAAAPNHWRALLAIAAVHSERREFETAKERTGAAMEACRGIGEPSCGADDIVRMQQFSAELDRALQAIADGVDPRLDPAGFRERVGDDRRPPVRVN